MATNDLVPWATGVGANVLTPAAYQVLQERQQGSQNGFANPLSFNEALRQASFAGSMIGQFSADYSGLSTFDDGNIPEFEASFVAALRRAVNAYFVGIDNGTTNTIVLGSVVPNITNYFFGMLVFGMIANTNSGATTMSVGSGPSVPVKRSSGSILQANDVIAGGFSAFMFDGWQFQLLGAWGGTSGGTVSPTPPVPTSNLTRACRLPPFGSGRWIYTFNQIIWLCPPSITSVRIRMVAGAGGGTVGATSAFGGGGGEFAYGNFTTTPGNYYLLLSGVGGAGAININDNSIPYVASTNGTLSSFGQCNVSGTPIGAPIMTALGGLSGDNGGAGGTGGTGGIGGGAPAPFFGRGAGGAGSALGGGGGSGSQQGAGGAGGQGGGGISPSGYGGAQGGGGSNWTPGDFATPGIGGQDFKAVFAGNATVVDGITPNFPFDFFPGGGGSKNVTVQYGPSNTWSKSQGPTIFLPGLPYANVGGNGGIGGGGGFGMGVTTISGQGGDGGIGGAGGGASSTTAGLPLGGFGGLGGGGGAAIGGYLGDALAGAGGGGIVILEW